MCQDLAASAKVPLVPTTGVDNLHQCVGNGMIIPNAGLVMLAALASLAPTKTFQAGG